MIAWLLACAPEPLVEGLGAGGDGMMVWGRRIAYGSAAGVVVADPESGDVEILDERSTHVLVRDGEGLISTPGECAEGCAVTAVHLDFAGGVETIAEGVAAHGVRTVVVESDGERLAYVPAADTAVVPTFVVLDRGTGATTPVRPGFPLAFAPDASEVLFRDGADGTEQIVTLATGDVRPAGLSLAAGDAVLAVKWGNALEVFAVREEEGGFALRRVGPEGGDALVFASPDPIAGPVAFAPSGTPRLAFWTHRCADRRGDACARERFTLWSVALDGAQRERVGHADFVSGPLYYDPEGERLAWESGGALFVADVRD